MWKKIIFWVFAVIATIVIAVLFYFRVFVYQPPLISEKNLLSTNLMPLPATMKIKGSYLNSEGFLFRLNENCDETINKAISRLGAVSPSNKSGNDFYINIVNSVSGVQKPVEDESYSLDISKSKVILESETKYGALRGLETVARLMEVSNGTIKIPVCTIQDSPRYSWRGLMIDVCRHWIPKDVVLRIIDGMAAVKLNVLHWHLSEYQGFRVESKVFPKLHELGSNGNYYSQDEIREIVEFASDRGIRVVPEFDLPGHSTSWLVGYPELGSTPGPYKLDTVYGVLNPVFDPTKNEVYTFLDQFFEEMCLLFPDEYIHIGGDEVHPCDWDNNPDIQEFMANEGFNGAHDLQAYFNKRLETILAKHGKKMVGWDEILHPGLANTVIVQSWRSQKSLWQAVRKGGKAILSAGWYLDHKLPAGKHYMVDPEILPNAITIEPDTLIWETYSLNLSFGENPIPAELTFYGKNTNRRGFFALMDNLIGFEKVECEGGNIEFKIKSEFGELTCKATISGNKFVGSLGLGLMKADLIGVKTGGDNMLGTHPPRVEKTEPLTENETKLIIGGEACMWTEVSDAVNFESRIWPRTAAIAEKLWSPASLTKNVDNMYRRLKLMDDYLVSRGAAHYFNQGKLIENIGGSEYAETIRVLVDVLEEVKYYNRLGSFSELIVTTPLTGLADAAMPESFMALEFNELIDDFLADSLAETNYIILKQLLEKWKTNHVMVTEIVKNGNKTESLESLSLKLSEAARVGLVLLEATKTNSKIADSEKEVFTKILANSKVPEGGAELAVVEAIQKLMPK